MSRKSRRQPKATPLYANDEHLQRLIDAAIERRMRPPANAKPLPEAMPQMASKPVSNALLAQMDAQQAPAKQGTPMFAPGAPLIPAQGLVNPQGPRGWQFPVGYNIASRPRNTETTSFETLRNIASLYDGIQLCEQVWLDTVAKLTLNIKPRPEIVAEQGGGQGSLAKYTDRIRRYTDFFSFPDQGNGYDLKAWLRAAVRDQLQIDAVAMYVRRNRAGGVYSLELVDGTTIKPLLDPRGRRPLPPYPSYQQFIYGVPAGLYTSEEMLYQRETTRTESVYGLSRVERIILRVNQALRKENKDLTRFTDGNVPPGILSPPDDGSQWTPEMLLEYQEMWDALLAGNDQARSRIKVIQPGSSLTTIVDPDIFVDFDRFLLNITAACYSMTMADLGFTENVNKSSGESQENVFYRRAVQPLMDRYAQLFTFILRHYFNEQDLVISWSGFEESEDFNAMAQSYVALTNAGITSQDVAARALNLPWHGPEIPNNVLTKEGLTFLEDAADATLRKAANDAKLAGLQLAAENPAATAGTSSPDGESETPENNAPAAKGNEKQHNTPPGHGAKQDGNEDDNEEQRIQRAADSDAQHTGIMVAFMLKPDVAKRLALPGGEPANDLHVTLTYLGDSSEISLENIDSEHLNATLTSFAHGTTPLRGVTGGLGRFINPGDDVNPVISLVNVPGLQDLRRNLANTLSMAGYPVHNDFDFTPHITLAYIDADAPMPADYVPTLPLIFDALCLAVGDERTYFPLGQPPTNDERNGTSDFFVAAVESGGHPVKYNWPWRQG